MDDKVEKIEIDENTNYQQDGKMSNDEKSNEQIMKEKIDFILGDLDEINTKKSKRNKHKSIFFTIGILLEIAIIVFIIMTTYINKPEKYAKEKICSSTELSDDYSIKNINKYYLDKDNNILKEVDSFTYVFNTEEKYNEFKTNYVFTNIKNFKGIKQDSVFDDKMLAFKTETIYTYSKLKKNKNVTIKGKEMTINIPNKETITIYLENYKNIKLLNESIGFICD